MKLRLAIFFIVSSFAVYIVGLYKHYSSLAPIDPQPIVIATIVWHNRVPWYAKRIITTEKWLTYTPKDRKLWRKIKTKSGIRYRIDDRTDWKITCSILTEWWSNGVVSQSRNYKGRESWRWYVHAAWVEDGSIIGYTYTIKQIPVDVDNKGRRYLPRVKY
jgi:hypothetical protein